MRTLIKTDSVSLNQIQQDLKAYKESLPEYEEIRRNTPSSTLTLIDDMISGFGSYLNYKYQKLRKETYLSTAELESSVLSIASMLGYNTNRPTCPILTFQYNAIPTMPLKHGDMIGTIDDGTPIVYFGNSRFMEKGDLIQFCVGYFNSTQPNLLSSFSIEDGNYKHVLVPSLAKAIDNQNVKVFVGNAEVIQTRDPEVYVVGPLPKVTLIRADSEAAMLATPNTQVGAVFYRTDKQKYYILEMPDYTNIQSWAEFLDAGSISINEYSGAVLNHSLNSSSAVLYLTNRDYFQGANINLSDNIEITWIETNGFKHLTQNSPISLDPKYFSLSLILSDSAGTNGDSISKIKQLAPLYYTALRRAVTEKDYKFIFEANEYIRSVEIEKDQGVAEKGTLTLFPNLLVGDIITIVFGDVYTINYTILANDTFTEQLDNSLCVQEKLVYMVNTTGLATLTWDSLNDVMTLVVNTDARVEFINFTNLAYTQIVKGIRPACCTVNVYYVKHNTTNIPLILSELEQKKVSGYMVNYKMVGITMLLIPATKIEHQIKVQVKLSSPSLQTKAYGAIRAVLDQYELTLNRSFSYGEFLAKVAQIQIDPDGSGALISPIVYILPDQTTFNVDGITSSYMKFIFAESDMNVVP